MERVSLFLYLGSQGLYALTVDELAPPSPFPGGDAGWLQLGSMDEIKIGFDHDLARASLIERGVYIFRRD